MLARLSDLLSRADRGSYAIGAFNVNNLETIQAVIDAAEAERSAVIIQTSEGALAYAGLETISCMVRTSAARATVPVAYHLDHGKDPDLVMHIIKHGAHTSVMFDGSSLPYEDNVRYTARIVKAAHAKRMSVEAEVGAIAGIEDFVSVSDRDAHLTNPEQAADFLKRTKCDALAIAIGTSHGAYKYAASSQLDFARLKAIDAAVSVPLVLHGASGVPTSIKSMCTRYGCDIKDAKGVSDAHIRKAVSLGIRKVNIDTDLRIAFDAGLRRYLHDEPSVIDLRKILGSARDVMETVVRQKMRLLGSAGRASRS